MSFQKLAGIAGLIFAVLVIVNTVAAGAPPAADDGIRDIVDYFSDYEAGIKIAAVAGALAGVPAVIWAVALFGRRRALGDESAAWALVGLLGFIASGAAIAVVTATQAILVINVDVMADSPALTEWWWQFTYTMSAFLFVATGVFLLGFGMAGLRGGAGPSWLNSLALLGALLSIVGGASPSAVGDGSPILFAAIGGFVIFLVFIIITSVEMLRSSEAGAATESV